PISKFGVRDRGRNAVLGLEPLLHFPECTVPCFGESLGQESRFWWGSQVRALGVGLECDFESQFASILGFGWSSSLGVGSGQR
uniref:Uncharacterized protein n=1 Tax=Cannabis sativa TaxID=3483 RepID=A0A803P584_CANSA